MNFSNYFDRICISNNVSSFVSIPLCARESFSKDRWITGFFLSNAISNFHSLSYSVFLVEDFLKSLFSKSKNVLFGLGAPFQISFRGSFFSSGIATENLANLVFFLNVF